ncbi:MAG: PD40 domain-containing protein [Chitinophagales bacterium]|nr:PD40 domain-containing protein [Chitinophagales bacterium]
MKFLRFFSLIIVLFSPGLLVAQNEFPATDLYLIDIKMVKGLPTFGEAKKITDWKGYDNQPSFTPDGKSVLYTSVRESGKADIFRYNMEEDRTTPEINTPLTAEYSPQLTPDRLNISCVRVMEDDSTQILVKFSNKDDNATVLFPKLQPVGYYCWATNDVVAMFVLGDTSTLQLGNVRTGQIKIVGKNIGRCLQKVPNRNAFSYVQKSDDSTQWTVHTRDAISGATATVVKCLPGTEDYCWLPDGTLLMGNGSKLYKFKPFLDKNGWVEVADFAGTPVAKFYRIAASLKGDKLCLVSYSGEKP